MAGLAEKYDYVMNDLSDPRVKNWIGFSSPAMVLSIIALYLSSIYIFLPAYMKNRKPYDLKNVIYYYNIFQIVSCLVLIYGVATSGWTTTYSWGCQPVDYSNNPQAINMLHWCYFTFVLKGIELIETVLFILRKKFNQVSKLHVYHHASTFFLTWIGTKYVGGGMSTFPIMINSVIHVFMYTYYLLASLGPEWQKKMAKWKPRLTIFQMVQFCVIIAHSLQSLHPECVVPKQLLLIYVPNVLLVFYMFWQFYQESYTPKQKNK
ncbi:very long chain fatty acid elongase AAEL008004 [Tribolium castaneum]|uniref:Elongation of very long chain fatty acids protein n=1 Tax=Tribolium castaneum TaxID=7070 RepID=D6WRK7_TRICA|nr:PREDICTED: elongation of very long chain fatty acids protein AAEL008004 [Tribolium castaneum]EFA05977.1 Elongation of very long chain fatty acids protein AAEL008004-like Protein [Tribolium castaneum]|eukprot:XP_008195976.1 PREDICTED: elongation of very long chain fatty acids protein AAEL008004 [Tribolium castaneum]